MNIIILSGGSGKRLWPLSNDIRSKQFIKIFRKEDGGYEPKVQRIYRQMKTVDPDSDLMETEIKKHLFRLVDHLQPFRGDMLPVNEPAGEAGETLLVPGGKPQPSGKLADFLFAQPRLTQRTEDVEFGNCGQTGPIVAVVIGIGPLGNPGYSVLPAGR